MNLSVTAYGNENRINGDLLATEEIDSQYDIQDIVSRAFEQLREHPMPIHRNIVELGPYLKGIIVSYPKQQIPRDIQQLLNQDSLLTSEQLTRLMRFMEDRDKIEFWRAVNNEIKKLIGIEPNIHTELYDAFESSEKTMEAASRFAHWTQNHSKMIHRLNNLNLSHKQITRMPEEIGNLKDLKSFYADNNNISSLPNTMRNLNQIVNVDLSHNKLNSLPLWIEDFQKLELLDVSHNKLKLVPGFFSSLKSIKFLYMAHNQIEYLTHDSLPPNCINLSKEGNPCNIQEETTNSREDFPYPVIDSERHALYTISEEPEGEPDPQISREECQNMISNLLSEFDEKFE